jgi:hypothetical protein
VSRNPYHIEGEPPTLRRSVLAYLDILGYTQMILDSHADGTHQAMLQKVHGALTEGRNWLEEKSLAESGLLLEKADFALKAFTDNIVIGWPIRDDGESEFGRAFDKLTFFQFDMVRRGFFLRGAISVGDAYVDEMAVFGGGFLDAYKAEASGARDPRIILTASAVELVKQHLGYYYSKPQAPQAAHLVCDSDGQWFLNYLDCVLFAEDECGPDYDAFLEHKAVIESKLEEFKDVPPLWAKYEWVARYHNYFWDLHPHYFNDEHRVNVALFQKGLTSIVDA